MEQIKKDNPQTFYFENGEHLINCLSENANLIFIKLSATWCGPCQRIAELVDEQYIRFPNNVICTTMDIDESNSTYNFLKKRVFSGQIPTIMCWYKGNTTIYPDDICTSSNNDVIVNFFNRCYSELK
jgi:thiol-disulfide isomerase/thioredoxin